MKMKGAAIGTIATVTALGMLGSLGGNEDIADTPVTDIITDTYAIVETVDINAESVIKTLESVITTTEIVTEPPEIVTEPPKPVTEAPKPVTEAPKPVTESPKPAQVLKIISVTTPIESGAKATLTIKGKPYTEYNIDVIYSTTASKAQGLENKISSADGNVSWTWKVGNGTSPGTYTIYISGGGERAEIKFRVYD